MANQRHRNTARADEIANVIHRIVDAMQPVAAQPRAIECMEAQKLTFATFFVGD